MKLSAPSTYLRTERSVCKGTITSAFFITTESCGIQSRREEIMFEAMSAILSGILLVILSMLAGGIVYFLLRDFLKSHIRNKD